MGIASQITSVVLRALELISASITAGLVGAYLHFVNDAGAQANGRLIYTVAIAGISIFFSIVFMPPLKYSFYGFPLDFALFVCWMVAFGLLDNLTGSQSCSSPWYWQNWGYYWGGYYYYIPPNQANPLLIGTAECSKWRATLAWSFIGGWFWLVSAALGIYVCAKDRYNAKIAKARPLEMQQTGTDNPAIATQS